MNSQALKELESGQEKQEKKSWLVAGDVFIQLPKDKVCSVIQAENRKIEALLLQQ